MWNLDTSGGMCYGSPLYRPATRIDVGFGGYWVYGRRSIATNRPFFSGGFPTESITKSITESILVSHDPHSSFAVGRTAPMNRRVSVWIGLIACGGSIVLPAGVARAQNFPTIGVAPSASGGLGGDLKSANDATAFAQTISDFLNAQLARVASDDPAEQKAGRDRIISECSAGSTNSFFNVYSQQLNTAVMAMLSKSPLPPLRVRLNIAVAVEAVAHQVKNDALKPTIIALMNDPTDVVALWGMKASKWIVDYLIAGAPLGGVGSDPLVMAILPAVKQHVKNGYVAEEAYRALSPDQGGTAVALIITPLLDLLNYRTSLYITGTPDNPSAESAVANFLFRNRNNVDAQTLNRIIQSLVDLVGVAGDRARTADKAVVEQIVPTLKISAQALVIISNDQSATMNQVMHMVAGKPGPEVYQLTKSVYPQMKQKFAFLQAPPQAGAPTTAATTAATTTTAPASN